MESSLAVPRVGVNASELPEAAELFGHAGPFVSVVLATGAETEDAAERFELEWAERQRRLLERGAPQPLLDRMGEWLLSARTEAPGLACVAAADAADTPLVTATGPEPSVELAEWDSLPRLGTIIEWHQASPPALLVVIDRTGADIYSGGPDAQLIDVVEGEDGPVVRRSAPGGWSQRRYQQRAQDQWRANAGEVARTVAELAQRIDARLVVVAGDDQAVQYTLGELPERVRNLVRRVEGGRGPGAEGELEEGTARWYRTAVAEDTVALIEKFKEELGQLDRGVAGVDDVVAALRMTAVDTLLLRDDPDDARRLFLREGDRTSVGVHEADLEGLDLFNARLPDAMIRAVWAAGGRVRITPGIPELTDGVGALLRFPVPAQGPT